MSGAGAATAGAPDPVAAARAACAIRDLDPSGARLLHHYSNAVVVLPRHGAVARVATGTHDVAQIRRSLDVARWLVEEHHFPLTAPLPDAGAVQVDLATTVSFWVYYPQPEIPAPLTSAHLGGMLARLHAAPVPPVELPRWVPLSSLEPALQDDDVGGALDDRDREWLRRRIEEMRDELADLDWPLGKGLIHGDAWAGNLLWENPTPDPDEVVLGDWDHVAYGPREVDLVPTWHAARRYGKGASWPVQFVDRYGYDLACWPGFPTMLAMRDLVQISGPLRRAPHSAVHADALRQRVDGLRAGDTTTIWTAL